MASKININTMKSIKMLIRKYKNNIGNVIQGFNPKELFNKLNKYFSKFCFVLSDVFIYKLAKLFNGLCYVVFIILHLNHVKSLSFNPK